MIWTKRTQREAFVGRRKWPWRHVRLDTLDIPPHPETFSSRCLLALTQAPTESRRLVFILRRLMAPDRWSSRSLEWKRFSEGICMKCILINFIFSLNSIEIINVDHKPKSGWFSVKGYRTLYNRMLIIIKSNIINLEGTRKVFNTTP